MSEQTGSKSKTREAWADVAKAISIILVVAHHAVVLEPNAPGYNEGILQLNNSLMLFRMPLFFFISGFFAKSVIEGNFDSFLHKRAIPLLYMYFLWSVIKWLLIIIVPIYVLGEEKNIYTIFYVLFAPLPTLWFIYALFLFFTLAWITRNLPKWLVFGISLIMYYSLAEEAQYLVEFPDKLARFFICFYSGYLIRPYLKDIGKKIPNWSIIPSLVFAFGLFTFVGPSPNINPSIMLALMGGNIAFGIIISELISRTPAKKVLCFIGKSTLALYVFHFVPVTLIKKIPLATYFDSVSLLVITLMAGIFIPIIAKETAIRLRLGWLFEAPSFNLRSADR